VTKIQELKIFFKWLFKFVGGGIVVYALAVIWTLNAYHFKVIDANDPEFVAENFRFEDYFHIDSHKDDLEYKWRAYDKVFKVGRSLGFIEFHHAENIRIALGTDSKDHAIQKIS
jgi:hypothetical protein